MTKNYIHIFESIPLGVVVIDLQGQIQIMNKCAKSILKMTDKPINHEHIHTLIGDQHSIPIANLLQTAYYGATVRNIIRNNGQVLEMVGGPLTGTKGVPLGAVITLRDITEVEKIQKLEKNNDRCALLGELSGDIAHEIRNPLGSIELLASLIKKESKRKKDINRANQIMAAVKTMESKISSLIHFSKTSEIPVTYVNVHDVLKDILLFSEKIIDGGSVFLSAQYACLEPMIECNPDMLKRVFLNLIMNALPEASRLDIITKHLEEQRTIEIYFIEQSGPAPKNVRSNILNRLLRTKEKNWGLGLAIVHNIVNMYNGFIRVEYLEDIGTAFVISFPLVGMRTPEIDTINNPIEQKKLKYEEIQNTHCR